MHGERGELETRVAEDKLRGWYYLVCGKPELDAAFTGGDVRVSLSGYIGIYADPDLYVRLLGVRDPSDQLQLLQRLHVQVPDAGTYGGAQFVSGLPHPTEHDVIRIEARGPSPGHLSNRDNVGSGAQLSKNLEDSKVAVGFDGEADLVASRA